MNRHELARIEDLDKKEGVGALDIVEIVEGNMAKERLNDMYFMEEIKWRQRAKVEEVKGTKTTYIST